MDYQGRRAPSRALSGALLLRVSVISALWLADGISNSGRRFLSPIVVEPVSLKTLNPNLLKYLVAPYRAILRYYRCDTPYSAILFKGGWHSPKMVRYPPIVLSFTQAHLCDTPFCNVSRDNCAIPHENKHENSFAILSLQVSRDMKSIAAGPLSLNKEVRPFFLSKRQ